MSKNPGCTYAEMLALCPPGGRSSLCKALTRLSRAKYLRREVVESPERDGSQWRRKVYAYWVV
ncbi:MAG: hypothetical protein AB7E27_04425 [Candidatus Methanomethylophilaceae archaeon]